MPTRSSTAHDNLFTKVKKAINAADPAGLLRLVQSMIAEVWGEMYGPNSSVVERLTPPDRFHGLAVALVAIVSTEAQHG